AAQVDVVTQRGDVAVHVPQVAGDGDLVHRIGHRAVFDPVAGCAPRVVSGDAVDALPHELGDQQSGAELAHQGLHAEPALARFDQQVVRAAGVAGGLQP